eukprot:Filipodium_phascolosomae@DN5611_c0_g1_i1.p1
MIRFVCIAFVSLACLAAAHTLHKLSSPQARWDKMTVVMSAHGGGEVHKQITNFSEDSVIPMKVEGQCETKRKGKQYLTVTVRVEYNYKKQSLEEELECLTGNVLSVVVNAEVRAKDKKVHIWSSMKDWAEIEFPLSENQFENVSGMRKIQRAVNSGGSGRSSTTDGDETVHEAKLTATTPTNPRVIIDLFIHETQSQAVAQLVPFPCNLSRGSPPAADRDITVNFKYFATTQSKVLRGSETTTLTKQEVKTLYTCGRKRMTDLKVRVYHDRASEDIVIEIMPGGHWAGKTVRFDESGKAGIAVTKH